MRSGTKSAVEIDPDTYFQTLLINLLLLVVTLTPILVYHSMTENFFLSASLSNLFERNHVGSRDYVGLANVTSINDF